MTMRGLEGGEADARAGRGPAEEDAGRDPLVAEPAGVAEPTVPHCERRPEGEHGALSGLYSTSRGIGIMLGPLLGGAAVELLRGPLADTDGYAAMWLVASAALLASIPLIRRLRRDERTRASG